MERLNNEDRLSAYFDGELPSNERSEMEERLRATPELRRQLDEFQMQRQWLAALPCPALSGDFTSRVMEQVLAAAVPPVSPPTAATITPPPFPLKTKRRLNATLISAALSTAAMVGIGYFVVNEFRKPINGGDHVATTGSDKPVDNDPSLNAPKNELPDSPGNSVPGTTIAANGGPEKNLPTNEAPVANLPKENAPKENEPIASVMPRESISKENTVDSNSNARTAINSAAVYAAATMKTPPKAYRVQIGARSEFDVRLKEAGVSVVASKVIDPPTHAPGVPSVNVLPDPEYVLVEGSESQLAELLEKLGAQTDLQLVESKNDIEASMLIDALCKMDAAKEPLRPSGAKEGEIAAFSFPVKALRPLIPSSLPTNNNPSPVPLPAGNSNSATPLKPYVPNKAPEKEGDALYVPRLVFILDVRMGEAERVPVK
jgi:hypothetical protein